MLFRDVGPLDICVVDEQHRFSVDQRRALAANGTHVVEISATPIPRTQALLLYGKLDVIRLTHRHSPQDIHTRVVERGGVEVKSKNGSLALEFKPFEIKTLRIARG